MAKKKDKVINCQSIRSGETERKGETQKAGEGKKVESELGVGRRETV